MVVRVAINGFGRIGRNVLRAIVESGRTDIEVVTINDLGPVETNAHLIRFDSVHGRFPGVVTTGAVNPRSSVNKWLPAGPPKIPNSCWTETTSTSLEFKKSAAHR